jgi:hypothetical protein
MKQTSFQVRYKESVCIIDFDRRCQHDTISVSAQAEPYDGYLMAHFTGESSMGEQIYFALSTDGLHWTDVNNSQPVLISNVGELGVRDPAIIRSADGTKFWIIATDLGLPAAKVGFAMHSGSTSWSSGNRPI